MDYMKYVIVVIIGLLATQSTGYGSYDDTDDDLIRAAKMASTQTGVPVRILLGLCFKESSLRPHIVVANDGGSPSYGLCQLKLSTAREMGFKGPVKRLKNPYVNTLYAAKYLYKKYIRYGKNWVKALSAYNVGHFSGVRIDYVNAVFSYALSLENLEE